MTDWVWEKEAGFCLNSRTPEGFPPARFLASEEAERSRSRTLPGWVPGGATISIDQVNAGAHCLREEVRQLSPTGCSVECAWIYLERWLAGIAFLCGTDQSHTISRHSGLSGGY